MCTITYYTSLSHWPPGVVAQSTTLHWWLHSTKCWTFYRICICDEYIKWGYQMRERAFGCKSGQLVAVKQLSNSYITTYMYTYITNQRYSFLVPHALPLTVQSPLLSISLFLNFLTERDTNKPPHSWNLYIYCIIKQ
jgi:hypothetical protein